MTLTFEFDEDNVKMNYYAIARTNTHRTECSTWTTKVVGKN